MTEEKIKEVLDQIRTHREYVEMLEIIMRDRVGVFLGFKQHRQITDLTNPGYARMQEVVKNVPIEAFISNVELQELEVSIHNGITRQIGFTKTLVAELEQSIDFKEVTAKVDFPFVEEIKRSFE